MTEHDAFIQAICENPDDDTPRLIYADWLEERGDPRGEFIRVQCELANAPAVEGMEHWSSEDGPWANCVCRPCELRRRERELLNTPDEDGYDNHYRWFNLDGVVPVYDLADWTFSRGFVATLTLPAESWLKHADALTAAAPLEEVTATRFRASLYTDRRNDLPRAVRWCRLKGRQRWHPIPYINATLQDYESVLRDEWPRIKFHLPH